MNSFTAYFNISGAGMNIEELAVFKDALNLTYGHAYMFDIEPRDGDTSLAVQLRPFICRVIEAPPETIRRPRNLPSGGTSQVRKTGCVVRHFYAKSEFSCEQMTQIVRESGMRIDGKAEMNTKGAYWVLKVKVN